MTTVQKSQFDDIILWTGKPLFKPYMINHIFSFKGTIQILLIGLAISLAGTLRSNTIFDWNTFLSFIAILSIAGAIQILLKIIGYRNIKYWITKEAVYIQSGVISPSVISIDKNKILSIDIKISKVEEKQNAGTVVIDDGEKKIRDLEEIKVYKNLMAIKNPDEAVKML